MNTKRLNRNVVELALVSGLILCGNAYQVHGATAKSSVSSSSATFIQIQCLNL